MIVDMVRGDIFQTHCKHIAFAVNTEGLNDAGFAGQVASKYWPGLANTGTSNLGDKFHCAIGSKVFHALVCHELGGSGWKHTPRFVEQCLNNLDIPEDEPIAIVAMGTGIFGQLGSADVYAILGGLARSKKQIIVYTRG